MAYLETSHPVHHTFTTAKAWRSAVEEASDAIVAAFPESSFRSAEVTGPQGVGKSETNDLRDAWSAVGDSATSGVFAVMQDLGQPTANDARLDFTNYGEFVVTGWVKGSNKELVDGLAGRLGTIFALHD